MRLAVAAALVAVTATPAVAGPTLAERGDVMDALVASVERVERVEALRGHDDPQFHDAVAEYAEIARVGGDDSTAFALGEALLRAARARESIDAPRLARALLLVAKVERLGDNRRARRLLDEALDLEADVRTANPELWASIVQQDANMRRHLTPGPAIERYREAVRLREAHSPRARWSLLDTLTWLGWNLREQGRLDEAREVLLRADAMATELGLHASFERAVIDGALGSLALSTGDLRAARVRFTRRDAVLDALWDRSPAGFQRRRLTNAGPSELSYLQLDDVGYEYAWQTAMRREGRVNADLQRLGAWRELDPEGYRVVAELRRARSLLPHLQDLAGAGDWEGMVDAVSLRTRILAARTEFLQRFPPPRVAVSDIQERLAGDEAYVGWLQYFFGTGYLHTTSESTEYMLGARWLYVIRRDSFHMVEVARATTLEDLRALHWGGEDYGRRLVTAASWPTAVAADPLVEAEARRVGELYFGGSESLLDGVRHLIVQISFVTPTVPIESLRLSDGRWVPDRFTTTYSLSAPTFVMQRDAADPPRIAAALLVGDATSSRLPHARQELATLSRTFESHVALTESEASQADLLCVADGTQRFAVAHLAGHFETERFEERSGMELSDGDVLEVHEVLDSWRLDADLVTLSGCKSIDVRGYNARVLPFVQALFTTGARRVVGNMFDADDAATMHLMLRFYENLVGGRPDVADGMPAREALREARVWLRDYRDEEGRQPYRHASYWAGFGLIGSP